MGATDTRRLDQIFRVKSWLNPYTIFEGNEKIENCEDKNQQDVLETKYLFILTITIFLLFLILPHR